MSEENERQKSNNQQKKKRRTRKDEEGRTFTCPCGKSYLSYPALYTHVKTKHQGKAPKQETGAAPKVQLEQQNETKDPLSQIKEIIDRYFPGDDVSAYPTPLSREDNDYVKQVIQNWENVKQTRLQDPSNNMSESINNIFGRFLFQMRNQVKSEGFVYLSQFVCCFYKGVLEQKKDKSYCAQGNGSQLPHFFNDFILKKRAPGFENKKGSPVNNLTLACKILYNFGTWMFEQRYTNFSVKFNSITS